MLSSIAVSGSAASPAKRTQVRGQARWAAFGVGAFDVHCGAELDALAEGQVVGQIVFPRTGNRAIGDFDDEVVAIVAGNVEAAFFVSGQTDGETPDVVLRLAGLEPSEKTAHAGVGAIGLTKDGGDLVAGVRRQFGLAGAKGDESSIFVAGRKLIAGVEMNAHWRVVGGDQGDRPFLGGNAVAVGLRDR